MGSNSQVSYENGSKYSLIKTTSVFLYTGVKNDNMENVFCKAFNTEGVTVESARYTLNVKCK